MEIQIETDRTILRNFKEPDLYDFYGYCSQEGVGEPAGWPRHETMAQSAEKLNDFIKVKNQFAICIYKRQLGKS